MNYRDNKLLASSIENQRELILKNIKGKESVELSFGKATVYNLGKVQGIIRVDIKLY